MEKEEKKEPQTVMNIRIDKDLKRQFRIKAEKNQTTMSEVMKSCINEYLKS